MDLAPSLRALQKIDLNSDQQLIAFPFILKERERGRKEIFTARKTCTQFHAVFCVCMSTGVDFEPYLVATNQLN